MLNFDSIRYFLLAIEGGKYQFIDGLLYKNGRKLGSVGKNGYLSYGTTNHRAYAHRLAFAYYHGISELEKHESINHKNGNKLDNSKGNLEGMSLAENSHHQALTGLGAKGSGTPQAVLTEYEVKQIKKLLRLGYIQNRIADHYNVSRSTILNIHNGSNWKHVDYDETIKIPLIKDGKKVKTRSNKMFDEQAVTKIKAMLGVGLTQKSIAEKFGVSRTLIGKIAQNRY